MSRRVDRSTYPKAAWERLGRAVAEARGAQRMTKPTLGYTVRSSCKSVVRLEAGRIYGDPLTAPPGDYNSERYWLRRIALLEMALLWDKGHATNILEGKTS